jgi:mono/diheme cytochrome c family protein
MKLILVFAVTGLLASCSDESSDPKARWTDGSLPSNLPVKPRWYTPEQVELGAVVFRENCATCHGPNAEGTPNWRKRDAEGRLPPPPLNGTAHAWHHSRDVLRRVVREGGQAFGGSMPAFAEKLSGRQIDQVIAWVQSNWSNEIYQRWQEIDEQADPLRN